MQQPAAQLPGGLIKELGLIPHDQPGGPLVANLAAFWQQISPIVPVLPTVPAHKSCAVYNLAFEAFHGMEEVIGSIPIRSTNQPLQNQAYAGSGALPPFHDFVSFCVTRAEGFRRLLTTVPAAADSFDFFRLCLSDFLSSELMELIVDWTLAGISCM